MKTNRVDEHYQEEMLALSKKKSKTYWDSQVKQKISEEKMLNEMFVILEYSDNLKEFVAALPEDTRKVIWAHFNAYFKTEG